MMRGDWVVLRLPPDFVRRGQVVSVKGYSMIIRWQGALHTSVLPWAGYYIEVGWLTAVEAPAHEPDAPQEARGLLEVAQAAAMLGTTSKAIRAMLRSGKLEGRKEGGKWLGVDHMSVLAARKSRSARATG